MFATNTIFKPVNVSISGFENRGNQTFVTMILHSGGAISCKYQHVFTGNWAVLLWYEEAGLVSHTRKKKVSSWCRLAIPKTKKKKSGARWWVEIRKRKQVEWKVHCLIKKTCIACWNLHEIKVLILDRSDMWGHRKNPKIVSGVFDGGYRSRQPLIFLSWYIYCTPLESSSIKQWKPDSLHLPSPAFSLTGLLSIHSALLCSSFSFSQNHVVPPECWSPRQMRSFGPTHEKGSFKLKQTFIFTAGLWL